MRTSSDAPHDKRSEHKPPSRGLDFWRLLRQMATLTGIVAVVAMGAGYALFGPPGLWGGLSGGAVTFAFCGTTVAVMGATMRRSVPVQSAWIVGSWIAKTFLVLAAFLVLEGVNGVDRTVLGATVLVGVLGSLALDARLVLRARQTTGD